ncbi:tetratricopeptide repeat protein [Acetobacter sp.]|uniref:tetratricopeptide repeat protein n=1 Tax=Acetobacter sp. TaxID=440 RepID=UPI0039EBEBA6
MLRKLLKLKSGPQTLASLLKQARKGDAAAMCQIGTAYLRGEQGASPHPGYAAWWFEKSARAGNDKACVHAARLAWDGFVPDDMALNASERGDRRTDDALTFARLGYERGEPEAALFLAWLLDATKTDAFEERKAALLAAAAHGLPLAAVGLADMEQRSGASVERVMALLAQPLEAGLGVAHHMVAVWYGQGGFLPQDAGKARSHLEIAAETGHVAAMAMLGECLMVENCKVPRSGEDGVARQERLRRLTRGETLLRKAASAENGRAACVLGDYWAVIADPPDVREALKWYERGVFLGDEGAMYMMARLVLTGQFQHLTSDEAHALMSRAAQKGHKAALQVVGGRKP